MIRFADETMRDDVSRLWHDCFGDSNEYVDFFLDQFDISKHMLVFIDGEKPVSMLSMLPMSVVTKVGMTLSGRYIYGVATDPRYRGRGISSKLLEHAHQYLRSVGVRVSILAPASGDLFNFYHQRGFESEFFIGSAAVNAEELSPFTESFFVNEASVTEYSVIREKAFSGSAMFVRWESDALQYRMAETSMLGGETLLLYTDPTTRAIAVCHNEGDVVNIKELALDGMSIPTALGILGHKYKAKEFRLRLPMDTDCGFRLERMPIAMAYWYSKEIKQMVRESYSPEGGAPYINLVLD